MQAFPADHCGVDVVHTVDADGDGEEGFEEGHIEDPVEQNDHHAQELDDAFDVVLSFVEHKVHVER